MVEPLQFLVIYASKPMGMFQFFLHKTGQLILVNCQVLICP